MSKLLRNVLVAFIHSLRRFTRLHRSTPDPCTAKTNSFKARVECVRMNPGEQSLCQRKPIPHRGASHWECTARVCLVEVRATGTKRTSFHRAKGSCANWLTFCSLAELAFHGSWAPVWHVKALWRWWSPDSRWIGCFAPLHVTIAASHWICY